MSFNVLLYLESSQHTHGNVAFYDPIRVQTLDSRWAAVERDIWYQNFKVDSFWGPLIKTLEQNGYELFIVQLCI